MPDTACLPTLAPRFRRVPLEPDGRYLPGDDWGTFLLTPEDWNPATFLADLPWMDPLP